MNASTVLPLASVSLAPVSLAPVSLAPIAPAPSSASRRPAARPGGGVKLLPAGRLAPRPSREDRWFATRDRTRRITMITAGVVVASALLHLAFVATALLTDSHAPVAANQEIAVEVIQEASKGPGPSAAEAGRSEKPAAGAAPEPAKPVSSTDAVKPPELKPALAPPETVEKQAESDVAKPAPAQPDSLKPEAAKPEPAKPEPTKLDAKPEAAKPEAAKTELAKPEPAKPEPAKPEAAKPEPAKPSAADANARGAEDAELAALQNELNSLKSQHAALRAEAARPETSAAPAPTAAAATLDALGIGPLAGASQAVALPGETTAADAEPVGYAALVFSRLAKAKEIGKRMGRPGTAGVQFDVDAAGRLTHVRLAASSGLKDLDDEAVAIVRKAAPFPVPPAGAQRSFTANVSFVPGQ